ncbi:gp117 [Bacillus phage G]|uniref:Gp117 n=1 Tax=Bacillus phage G TaxID=2884420 RepID=G3MBH9_9CAUD|nr:gp117 [Bacillus phage G]AEO93379.1 gp117 [Bacillus phage G]
MKKLISKFKSFFERVGELLFKILDRRVSVAKVAKAEDLVISNASLKNIKRGMRKVYNEVYGAREDKK